jgi:glycosyltransferase involved in cell wall biosynthesis
MVTSVSIIIPCLNEGKTLEQCIKKAKIFTGLITFPSEIIVADNGSIDNSIAICKKENIKFITVPSKGYGSALHAGITNANSSHVIFADADDSYDFRESYKFMELFENGYDLVVGNRFKGGMQTNAMPFLHRFIGTPVISFLGRRSFHVSLGDFNCGMRGIKKDAYLRLNMQSAGMEYATELIAKAAFNNHKIGEVPIRFYKDGRGGKSHLNTWSDGWKHLKLILLLSPRWILLYPAIIFSLIGLMLGTFILFNKATFLHVTFDIQTLYFCSVFLILALIFFEFYFLVNFYGSRLGLYAKSKFNNWIFNKINFENGLITGLLLFFLGFLLSSIALFTWYKKAFRELNPEENFRIIIPGGFLIIAGLQFIVFSFLITMMKTNNRLS